MVLANIVDKTYSNYYNTRMADNSYFNNFSPVIEYIDVIRKNLRDSDKVTFKVNGDPTTVIKWCRRNFGERGDGWDFSGGLNPDVTIWSSKLKVMWELWQQ